MLHSRLLLGFCALSAIAAPAARAQDTATVEPPTQIAAAVSSDDVATSSAPAAAASDNPVAAPADAGMKYYPGNAALYRPNTEPATFRNLPAHLLRDQAAIWTSPARIRWDDARFLVPLAVFTGLLIGSDHHSATVSIRPTADNQTQAQHVADGTLAGLGLITAGMLFEGTVGQNPHARETSILSLESLADTMVVNNVARGVFGRERPGQDNARGKFFQYSGFSFPSNHAAAAWSLASVLGQEYPGPWSRAAVYSLASAVSIARIAGEEHFPSDVLVGSAAGWLIGRYVYRARHDGRYTVDFRSADPAPDVPLRHAYTPAQAVNDPAAANKLQVSETHLGDLAEVSPPLAAREPMALDSRGSVYVPMDSWVYPALMRLWSLGFVPSQSASIRPWTRAECLRQVAEAQAHIQMTMVDRSSDAGDRRNAEEAARLLGALERQFRDENDSYEKLQLDSVYSRATTIAGGPALMRSWEFGQTLDNDYGRPFSQGTNLNGGFSASATSGRWSFYAREEYQHAAGYSTYPPDVYDFITGPIDGNVFVPPATGFIDTVNRQRPLELYTGYQAGGYEFQFGKQELYWGPSYDAPLSWSVNAEPTYNFQFVSTRPHSWPGFLSVLGQWRVELVVGKLSGHTTPARPWFNGQKVVFDFTPNFEISITRWSLWAGVGSPFTFHNFIYNLFSFSSNGDARDPGDRKSALDFRYRLPFARWVTVYTDSYADDEINPLSSPRRSAWAPGIYLSRLPGLPHMDLRFEVPSTLLFSSDHGADFIYINDHYVDANTNKAFFVGDSVGRDGRRYEGWTSWWFNGQDRVEFGYRQTQRSNQLLPVFNNPNTTGGGTQSDASVRGTWALSEHWSVDAMTQYERWYEPLLSATDKHNVTGQFEIKWEPKLSVKR